MSLPRQLSKHKLHSSLWNKPTRKQYKFHCIPNSCFFLNNKNFFFFFLKCWYTCNLSRYWGWPWPLLMVPVSSKSLSASVDLPWSTWAIMEKFLILSVGYWLKSKQFSLLFWREWEQKPLLKPKWSSSLLLSLVYSGLALNVEGNGCVREKCLSDFRVFEVLLR